MVRQIKAKFVTFALAAVMSLGVMPADAAESNIIKSMDFEDFSEGKALKGTANWDVKLLEGDECIIATDPVTNSKAIKFTKGATEDNAYIEYTLPSEITSGLVRVSYDVRIASATKYNQIFGTVRNKAWSNFITPRIKGAFLYDGDAKYIGNAKDDIGKDRCHYEQLIDIGGGTLEYTVYKNGSPIMKYNVSGLNKGNVARLIFAAFEDRTWGVNAWECTYQSGTKIPNNTDPAGVLYIDNIVFEKITIGINSVYPEDGSENVPVQSDIKMNFNTPAKSDITEYVDIYKDGDKLGGGYKVTSNGNESAVAFDDGLLYDSEYTVTVKAGMPAKNASYGTLSSDYTFGFKTESIIPEDIGIKDGGRYNKEAKAEFADKEGITYSAELKKADGEFYEYISGTVIDEEGEYILRLTAEKNGKKQIKEYTFKVVGLVAPRAENVKAEIEGTKFTGSYTFIDDNGDAEGETSVRWLMAEEENGDYKEVGTLREYEVSENDEGKYIKFGVTPRSVSEPTEGEEIFSDVIVLPAKPVVKGDINVTGEIALDSELSAEYQYYDKNGDAENGTVYTWYRTDEDAKVKEKIEGAEASSYKLTEDDIDCYIVLGITPKNSAVFGVGEEYRSKPVMLMYSPEAQEVEISGTPEAGKSVSASYKFFDKNKDKEGKTKIEWYLNGKLVSEEAGYLIPKGSSGLLTLKITPVSENFPFEGSTAEVFANIRNVSYKGGSSSSGSSGGGFSVSSGNGAVKLNPVIEEKKEEAEKKELSDMSGHWSENSVNRLFQKGIVTGDEQSRFNPNKKITRAETAALIVRALNLEEEYKNLYVDVKGGEWFAQIICAVSSAGIMKGDTVSFRPNAYITREELCVVLCNALNFKNIKTMSGEITFADKDSISAWAEESVKTCVTMELVQGVGGNLMSPKAHATKAQAAVIIDKLLEMEAQN